MNESMEEELRKKRDMLYYNQLVMNERKANAKKNKKHKVKNTTFSSQKVDFSDYIYVPEEWKALAYAVYFVLLPYIAGAIFLFLIIAHASYDNFMLLNLNAFPVVWLIGYEIVSICLLVWILILYLNYADDDEY
jgi:hypothetical protein